MSPRPALLALSLALVSGCSAAPTESDPELAALLAAPTAIDVGSQTVRASAEVTRDFSASARQAGSPITVTIQFPRGTPAVTVTQVWVLFGRESWAGTVHQVEGTNRWQAQGGPEWPVGSQVDVVGGIRLVGSGAGRIRVAGVPVQGIY